MCGIKLLLHSQTSTVAPLKFGNGLVIWSHIFNGCNLLCLLGLKLNYVGKRGPRRVKDMLLTGHLIMYAIIIMTSSNGNVLRFTGPLCWEFTGHRWIPLTKASDAELWYFLCLNKRPTNNRDAGDLKHHRARYGVTVMWFYCMHANIVLWQIYFLKLKAMYSNPFTMMWSRLLVSPYVKFFKPPQKNTCTIYIEADIVLFNIPNCHIKVYIPLIQITDAYENNQFFGTNDAWNILCEEVLETQGARTSATTVST